MIAGRAVTGRRLLTNDGPFREATVGENTFVAAGAVVAEDVPPRLIRIIVAIYRYAPTPGPAQSGNNLQ